MKIGEFAEMNNVTTKMLRHYDEIGLLKPSEIDPATGYRSYEAEQSHYLNWIIILKNLDFSLVQIKEMLSGPISSKKIIHELIQKRIEISSAFNEQMQKKIEINRLIKILEKEGFQMDRQIDLLTIDKDSVHEIKKNIPNMEMFLETAVNIANLCQKSDSKAVLRFDIRQFKQINDDFGFDVGDSIIVACYNIINSNIKKHLSQVTLGRAHGDEFIIFAKARMDEAEKTARAIIDEMNHFDYSAIGCDRQVGCSIGGLIGQPATVSDIRNMIESSIETIIQAKRKGSYPVIIQPYMK